MSRAEQQRSDLDAPVVEVTSGRRRWRRRSIRFVQQLTQRECGAACLAMVLNYFGKDVSLSEARGHVSLDRDGTNAEAIIAAGEMHGLIGRGFRIQPSDLASVSRPAILHWEFNHFVVFDRIRRGAAEIVDPAAGRRRVPLERFWKAFTGVALVFEPGEQFRPGGSRPNQVWRYLKKIVAYRGLWARVITSSILLQLVGLAPPLLINGIVESVLPRADLNLLWVLSASFTALLTFQFVAGLTRSHVLLRLRTVLDADLTRGFLTHLTDLSYEFFDRRSAGDLLMRLSSNATIREILTSNVLSGVLDGMMALLYLVLLLVVSPLVGAAALAIGATKLTLSLLSWKLQRELLSEGLRAQADLQTFEMEMLRGLETLKTMGIEPQVVETWWTRFVSTLNVSLARGRLSSTIDALQGGVSSATPFVILVVGTAQVIHGRITLGTMLALNALASGFLSPFGSLLGGVSQFQRMKVLLERIEDVFETPAERRPGARAERRTLSGAVTLENVSFRYAPLAPLVIKHVTLNVEPAQFVAIVGRSASGKSTLARLLASLYAPTAGRILYDGIDLQALDPRSVRRQLGIVVQRPFLFGLTIRQNLSLANPDLSFQDVVRACRIAEIHDEIEALPLKYDTVLSGAGAALSGGQRQRLVLARALVGRPKILILDEATSALDALTEAKVHAALNALECTRIVIAHRLSTVTNADRIVVLEEGRGVEEGTHAELLARDGVYASLVAAQLEDPRQRTEREARARRANPARVVGGEA